MSQRENTSDIRLVIKTQTMLLESCLCLVENKAKKRETVNQKVSLGLFIRDAYIMIFAFNDLILYW